MAVVDHLEKVAVQQLARAGQGVGGFKLPRSAGRVRAKNPSDQGIIQSENLAEREIGPTR